MALALLVSRVCDLAKSYVATQVEGRINEFKILYSKQNQDWFSELCFCILTANSSARLGMKIQESIGVEDFLRLPEKELAGRLRELGHRYSERRASYIVQARKFSNIRDIVTGISDERKAREWLVENIMGLGYKEASHFLRNVGYHNLAILDRHVLRIMGEHKMMDEVPKALTRRRYLDYEARLQSFASRLDIPLSKLDLYLWYMKTGAVLK
jgi:N-glycosylase/DNA lyase